MDCVPSKAADRITPAKTPHTPANIHSYTHKTTACGKPNTGVNTKEMLLDFTYVVEVEDLSRTNQIMKKKSTRKRHSQPI